MSMLLNHSTPTYSTGAISINKHMDPDSVLNRVFGHVGFRGNQLQAIERILSQQHAMVIMPTGMGKSLCYQIPAIILASQNASRDQARGFTLVISPLIALMKDQVDTLQDRGISAAFINSSLTRKQREKRYSAVARGHYQILYVTPERFRKSEFIEIIQKRTIHLLAVDEAHCISEWGHDFRPDYTRMKEFRKLIGNPVTLALTATATPEVQQDIVQQLGMQEKEITLFHEGIDRPNLNLKVIEVWGEEEKLTHMLRIRKEHPGSAIIYFTLIKTLHQFSDYLQSHDIEHLRYHGDLDRVERRRVQDQFMKEPNHLVLATNAFGMGIDKEDIRFVIHADIPGSMESYYQEIGRSGRDGKPSDCILLYDERDLATQMEFLKWSNPDAEYYVRLYDLLKHDEERVSAYGLEWVREQLHFKDPFDHRLETALSILDRFDVSKGTQDPFHIRVIGDLPEVLGNPSYLETKHQRDLHKLYALVQYVKHSDNRKKFIHDYFGLPYGTSKTCPFPEDKPVEPSC